MTSNSEKLRSLFLTALMVFSVFAMTTGFAGSAAAAGNEAPTVEQAIEYSDAGTNAGNIEISFEQSVGTANGTSNALGAENITLYVDDSEVSFDNSQISATGANPGGVTSTATASNNPADAYTITGLNNLDPNQEVIVNIGTINTTLDSDIDGQFTGTPGNVTVDVTSVEAKHTSSANAQEDALQVYAGSPLHLEGPGPDTDVRINRVGGGNELDGATPDNSSHLAFSTSNLDTGATYRIRYPSSDVYFNVSSLNLQASEESTEITDEDFINVSATATRGSSPVTATLYDDDGDEVAKQVESFSGAGRAEFNFSDSNTDIDESDYYTVEVVDNKTAQSVTTEQINITEASDDEASFGESIISDNRGDMVQIPVQVDGTDEATLLIGDRVDDNYDAVIQVTDDDGDGEVLVNFNTYTAGVDNSTVGQGAIVTAEDSDDEVNLINQNGSFTNDRVPGHRILAASDYEMNVTAGHVDFVDEEDDVATLSLSERSTDGAQAWSAPASKFSDIQELDSDETAPVYDLINNDNITQTDTIAAGDTAIIQIEASGLEGILDYHTSGALSSSNLTSADNATQAYVAQAAATDGTFQNSTNPQPFDDLGVFRHTLDETNPAANTIENRYELDELGSQNYQNISVIYDAGNDTHFVVIDTQALVDAGVSDGDELRANFSTLGKSGGFQTVSDDADPDLQRNAESVEVDDTFTVEDADATLNDGDEITLQAAAAQEIPGETNLAPGTEVTASVKSTTSGSPFLLQPTAVVQSDGTFTAVADFSDRSPGANFTVQTKSGGDVGDSIDGTLVEGETATVSISDQESTGDTVTVDSATLANGGFIAIHNGSAGGEVLGASEYLEAGSHSDIEVTLDSTQSEDFTAVAMPHFDTDGDEEYEFNASADDGVDAPYTDADGPVTDSASVTIVEETTTTEEPTTEETTTTEGGMTDMSTETPTEGDGPGFTAVIALVALVAAALLAVRRNN